MSLICCEEQSGRDNRSSRSAHHTIIKESAYLAKVVDPANTAEYDACLRLRHDYFVKKRHWVTSPHPDKEYDHYDPYCTHLAVFHNTDVLAYMRLLPWQPHTGFMLEHDFKQLLSLDQPIIHHNSAELSRLVMAPQKPNNHANVGQPSSGPYDCDESHTLLFPNGIGQLVHPPSAPRGDVELATSTLPVLTVGDQNTLPLMTASPLYLLFKLFFHVARQECAEMLYIVVEPPLLRIMQSKFGFPFQPLGRKAVHENGTHTQAAFASLENIAHSVSAQFPDQYAWYAS